MQKNLMYFLKFIMPLFKEVGVYYFAHVSFSFKHIYLSLLVKQILATYINHAQVRFLEPTSTGVM